MQDFEIYTVGLSTKNLRCVQIAVTSSSWDLEVKFSENLVILKNEAMKDCKIYTIGVSNWRLSGSTGSSHYFYFLKST